MLIKLHVYYNLAYDSHTFNKVIWLLGNVLELYQKYSYTTPFLPSDCVFEDGKLSSWCGGEWWCWDWWRRSESLDPNGTSGVYDDKEYTLWDRCSWVAKMLADPEDEVSEPMIWAAQEFPFLNSGFVKVFLPELRHRDLAKEKYSFNII